MFGHIESDVPRSHSFGDMTFGIGGRNLDLWRKGKRGYVDVGGFSTQIIFKTLNLKQVI